jgi:hypothetical protein
MLEAMARITPSQPNDAMACLPTKLTQGDIPLGLMQNSLRSRFSRKPMDDTTKTKEKK